MPSCLSADGRPDIVEAVYDHAYAKLKDCFTLRPYADVNKELPPEERKRLASDKAAKSGRSCVLFCFALCCISQQLVW